MSEIKAGYVVSQGSLRDEDLAFAFTTFLRLHGKPEHMAIMGKAASLLREYGAFGWIANLENDGLITSNEASAWDDFIYNTLYSTLEKYAPEGCRFGSHDNDGALIGFWEDIEQEW